MINSVGSAANAKGATIVARAIGLGVSAPGRFVEAISDSSSTEPSPLLSQKAFSGNRLGWCSRLTSCSARNSVRPSAPPSRMILSAASAPPGAVAFHTSPKPPRPNSRTRRYPAPGIGSSPSW